MGRHLTALAAVAALLIGPGAALAERPVVCLLPLADARPAKSPQSVPYQVRAENAPEPIRAHPADGPSAVHRAVLGAWRAEGGVEVVDFSGADLGSLGRDPRLGRCHVLVGGAVFHYEGTVAVDLYGGKIFTGLVGYELVAADPRSGRRLMPPVVFAGRRQSEVVKAGADYSTSDRQTFGQWVAEALKVASASLRERFVRPAAQGAARGLAGPQ